MRVFAVWKNTEVTVTFDDGERRGRMHDVIVANGQWHGGGMKLAPGAEPDDGLFDVVLIGDVTKLDFVTTAPKLYKGGHVTHPRIEVLRSAHRHGRRTGAAADRGRRRADRNDPGAVRDRAGRAARSGAVLATSASASPLALREGAASSSSQGSWRRFLERGQPLLDRNDALLDPVEPAHDLLDAILHVHRALERVPRRGALRELAERLFSGRLQLGDNSPFRHVTPFGSDLH